MATEHSTSPGFEQLSGSHSDVDTVIQYSDYDLDLVALEAILADLFVTVDKLNESRRQHLLAIAKLINDNAATSRLMGAIQQNGTFALRPTQDEMSLALDVSAPIVGGTAVEVSDILAWLKARNIEHGVDHDRIQSAVNQAKSGQDVRGIVVVTGLSAISPDPANHSLSGSSGCPHTDHH